MSAASPETAPAPRPPAPRPFGPLSYGSDGALQLSGVALADEKGARLDELSLEDLQSVHADITAAVFDVLSVEASVASRQSFGGTAPDRVREAIAAARSQL